MGARFVIPLIFFLALLMSVGSGIGDCAVQLNAHLNRASATLDDNVTYTVSISGESAGDPEFPDFNGFQILTGPMTSTSISIVNGQMSQSASYSFVLLPMQAGDLTIQPTKINQGGQVFASNPVTLRVIDRQGPAPANPPHQQGPHVQGPGGPPPGHAGDSSQQQEPGDDIFIRVTPDKQEAFIGEQVTLTYELFFRANLANVSFRQQPTTTGFWSEDLNSPRQLDVRETVLNGKKFQTALLRRIAVFPTTAGDLTVGPLIVQLDVRSQRRGRDPFDPFFSSPFDDMFGRTQTIVRQSESVVVRALPLPEAGRPADFSGAVGRFGIKAETDKTTVKTNDAFTLKVTLGGEGTLQPAKDLEFPAIEGVKEYAPQKKDVTGIQDLRFVSERSYEYILQPREVGQLTIPPIKFSYFDPVARAYKTIRSTPFIMNIAQGEAEPVAQQGLAIGKEEVTLLGMDVRYNKPVPERLRLGPHLDQRPSVWAGFVLPPLLISVFWLYQRRRDRFMVDRRYARSMKAWKRARKHLSLARKYQHKGAARESLEHLRLTVLGYIADKLNVPEAGMTAGGLDDLLAARAAPAAMRQSVREFLTSVDFAMFAPSQTDAAKTAELCRDAEAILKHLVRLRTLKGQ